MEMKTNDWNFLDKSDSKKDQEITYSCLLHKIIFDKIYVLLVQLKWRYL